MSEMMVDLTAKVTEMYHAEIESGAIVDDLGLPLSFEGLTPEFLTAILCRDVPGAAVTGVDLGPRDDGSSNRRRVFITYNAAGEAAGLPATVFGKASHGLANRINYAFAGVGACEARFFETVRPLCDFETPRSYFARYNPRNFNSLILLEDIGDKVEFCDHHTVISRSRAEGEIKLLAKMHATFEDHPLVNARSLDLPTWPEFFDNCAVNALEECTDRGFREAEAQIPGRLFSRFAEIWPATLKSVDMHRGMIPTMLHGDCHLKQWYIRQGPSGEDMGVTDWQNCSIGHWGRDVAYNMATSLTVEDRRAWERDLLALYLEELRHHGGTAPSFAEAWDIYRANLFSALAWWTVTLTPNDNQPDMQPEDTSREFIHRISHAIDDTDALSVFG